MKTRRLSLELKLTIMVTVLCILLIALLDISAYLNISKSMLAASKTNTVDYATVAASQIDGDVFASIESKESKEYQDTLAYLSHYLAGSKVQYIYTMKKLSDTKTQFVVDADPEEPADLFEEYDMVSAMEIAFSGVANADDNPTVDKWGTFFSICANS